jgi:hypothetical protein
VTQHASLNNTEHSDLRVITALGAAYGDDVMYALTFPSEFRNLQAHYPIVFGKAREKQLDAEALGKLHIQGYLQAVYMVIASLSNFRELIERASRLNAAQR